MALDAADTATLIEMFSVSQLAMETHLESVTSGLTAEILEKIEDDILLWDDYRNVEDVNIHPNVANFGAEITGGQMRARIRERVAAWLSFPYMGSSNQFFVRTERS